MTRRSRRAASEPSPARNFVARTPTWSSRRSARSRCSTCSRPCPACSIDGGKVVVDRATGATSVPRLFAGGDCLRNGGEVVDAVQDGKIAARGIHAR